MAATYKRATVESALEAKGFRRRESDHSYFVYYTEEGAKTPIRTKTSHGRGGADIPGHLLARMPKQCKLRTADFRALVDCTLLRAGYEAMLAAGGDISTRCLGLRFQAGGLGGGRRFRLRPHVPRREGPTSNSGPTTGVWAEASLDTTWSPVRGVA